ncbi:MAG: hypothetical protein K2I56_01620, partial [Muribaculaceae bacterium]|nr:hypothetical protein [Muribaculaceae bacterium]
MKRLSFILVSAALLAPPTLLSGHSPSDDGFDSFISGAMSDFDGFIDEANRDFIDFMRNPWKKYDAVKPVEKRVIPEPAEQPKAAPGEKAPEKPTPLTIEEIIDLTNREGGIKEGEEFGFPKTPGIPSAPKKPSTQSAPSSQSTPSTPQKPSAPSSPSSPST